MPRDNTVINDGFFTLEAGMNSGSAPNILPKNQCAFMTNVTTRGGFTRTRPRFNNIELDFQEEEEAETWFNEHAVSGWSYYRASSGSPLWVFCCGGRFFTISVVNKVGTVNEITPTDSYGRNVQYLPKTWFCQAAQYLIAQNGVDRAFIFDGSTGFRSDITQNQVPTGRQMAYINGRLFVVMPNGREIYPGDLAYVTPTSVIEFTEIFRPAIEGGQPLQIPIENGIITALVATAQMDTQAGQGTLLACSAKSVTSFNPIIQRSQWPNITLQSIALVGNGFVNSDLALVNGDVWGRSWDGWRSYVMARREFSQWGNRPQSHEIERIIERESKQIISSESFVYFDNRLLGCCTPVQVETGGGIYHKGIVALNFENLSSITTVSNPGYDGLWTGIQPYGLVTGEAEGYDRCFAFCRNIDGTNSFWEITTEYGDDDGHSRIQCFIETRSFNYDKPSIWKSIAGCELAIDELAGSVDIDIKYRPDQYPCWFDWIEHTECATMSDCSIYDDQGCQIPSTYRPQYRPRLAFGLPERECIESLGVTAERGYEFQARIQWTGNIRVKSFILFADQQDPEPKVLCG